MEGRSMVSMPVRMCLDVQLPRGPRSPGATNVGQSATQNDTKPQESSNIHKDEWLVAIENHVDDTTDKSQIQRIPSLLREKQSNNCYDPHVVSIGPYHHGNPQLDTFEKLKIPIAQKFIRACGNQVSMEELYDEVARMGKIAREYYEEGSIEVKDDEAFNRMMFLDACFVVHFMSISSYGIDKLDPLLPWICNFAFVQRDLFLLENQIPLLLLKVLIKFRCENEGERTKLIQNFLDQKVTIMPPEKNSCTDAVKKYLAQKMGCSVQKKEKWKLDMDAPPTHLLHLVREQLIGPSPKDENEKQFVKWHSYRSVTELVSAGIHFRLSQTNHVTDVKFKSHLTSGTLTLPPIMVDDSTNDFLLNLVAYEMCPHGPSDYHITSYVCLMDSLIDHADDVKELRKRRILVNNLGSDKELAQLFNDISKNLVPDPRAYSDIKLQIENHCKSKAQVWMAEWTHDHFSSPWALLAFLGAIFALALTLLQTYIAVFSALKVSGHKTS